MSLYIYYGVLVPFENLTIHLDEDFLLEFEDTLSFTRNSDLNGLILGFEVYLDSFNGLRTNAIDLPITGPSWQEFTDAYMKFSNKDVFKDWIPKKKIINFMF